MDSVATPLRRLVRSDSAGDDDLSNVRKDGQRTRQPSISPDEKFPCSRALSLRVVGSVDEDADADFCIKTGKATSKRPVSTMEEEGVEDSGRFQPVPAKRCKLLDEAGEEPTEEMRSLDCQVISLARRPDRMEKCTERLGLRCPWLEHSYFEATNGKEATISLNDVVISWNTASNVVYQKKRSIRKGWNDLDSYVVRQLDLSPGERGCALSHIRAWKMCLERAGDSNRPLFVMEDDAAPTAEFTPVLRRALAALPTDAHVLYLGYSQAADWRREVSENLVECEYVWTTVGYIIWPAGARMLLSRLPIDGPVDNWMAAQCAKGDLNSYATRPKIILQADEWNVNSDVTHSDEHYWGADSDIHHSDHLYWGSAAATEPSVDGSLPSASHRGVVDRSNTIWGGLDEESEASEDSAGEDA